MNRREFTKSLAAAFTLPALPLPAISAAQPVTVTKAARFWAIYMTHMHGDVTPGMLTQMTGLDPVQTTAIRTKLIADKVISPTGFIRKSLATETITRSEQHIQDTLKRVKPTEKIETQDFDKSTRQSDPDEPEEELQAQEEAHPDDLEQELTEDTEPTTAPDDAEMKSTPDEQSTDHG